MYGILRGNNAGRHKNTKFEHGSMTAGGHAVANVLKTKKGTFFNCLIYKIYS